MSDIEFKNGVCWGSNEGEKGLTGMQWFWITCPGRLGSSIGRAVDS